MASPLFILRLIGRGDLDIPEALQGKVFKQTDMAYKVQSSGLRPLPCAPGNHVLLSARKPECLSLSIHCSVCYGGQLEGLDCAAQEYYRTIQEAVAIVPAFSSDAYYTVKASSSVAAAIICGTLHWCFISSINAKAVKMSKGLIHLQQPGETDTAAMARLLALPAFEVNKFPDLPLLHLQCCNRAKHAKWAMQWYYTTADDYRDLGRPQCRQYIN